MLPCLVLVVNSDQLQSYLHAHTTLATHSYALLHDDVIKSYTDTELGALLGTGSNKTFNVPIIHGYF